MDHFRMYCGNLAKYLNVEISARIIDEMYYPKYQNLDNEKIGKVFDWLRDNPRIIASTNKAQFPLTTDFDRALSSLVKNDRYAKDRIDINKSGETYCTSGEIQTICRELQEKFVPPYKKNNGVPSRREKAELYLDKFKNGEVFLPSIKEWVSEYDVENVDVYKIYPREKIMQLIMKGY